MSDDKLLQELEAVKQRLQELEDKEAIRDLLVRYGFTADLSRTNDYVDLWTEDAIFDVGTEYGLWKGKDKIRQLMEGPVHQSITNNSQHLMLDYIINVDGDKATAAGYCLVTLHWQAGFGIFRCSFRTFSFQRIDGRWLIKEAKSRATGDPECNQIISRDW
ncbi:nuclear transport factor 2 family protein [Chloroflexota bacterium]